MNFHAWPNLLSRILLPFALLVGGASSVFAAPEEGQDDVKATVLTFDGRPGADGCARFDEFRSDARYQDYLSHLPVHQVSAWRGLVCDEQTLLTITLLEKSAPAAAADESFEPAIPERKIKASADLTGSYSSGNTNFFSIKGATAIDHEFNTDHHVNFTASFADRSDSNAQQRRSALFYDYHLADHWALFAVVTVEHDRPKQLDLGQEGYVGVIWRPFPKPKTGKPFVALSFGMGDRYNQSASGTPESITSKAVVASYRVKYRQAVTPFVRVAAELWYQNSFYGPIGTPEERFFNFADYRVLGLAQIEIGNEKKPWNFLVTFRDEYWSQPVKKTNANDLEIHFGVRYKIDRKWRRRTDGLVRPTGL